MYISSEDEKKAGHLFCLGGHISISIDSSQLKVSNSSESVIVDTHDKMFLRLNESNKTAYAVKVENDHSVTCTSFGVGTKEVEVHRPESSTAVGLRQTYARFSGFKYNLLH